MFEILLVEDNKETANFVKQALELEDLKVDVAFDGEEGLEKFKEKEYDLILLDLEMPKMNGEELLQKIRKENPYIDIIVYTNYAEFGNIPKLVNMGINGYINKGGSADLETLVNLIKAKLEPMNEGEMDQLISLTEEMKKDRV